MVLFLAATCGCWKTSEAIAARLREGNRLSGATSPTAAGQSCLATGSGSESCLVLHDSGKDHNQSVQLCEFRPARCCSQRIADRCCRTDQRNDSRVAQCRSRRCWHRRVFARCPKAVGIRPAAGLLGAAGQITGTTPTGLNVDRAGVGTGVYSLGSPRQIEFALQLRSLPLACALELTDSTCEEGFVRRSKPQQAGCDKPETGGRHSCSAATRINYRERSDWSFVANVTNRTLSFSRELRLSRFENRVRELRGCRYSDIACLYRVGSSYVFDMA
jgi:hypothetical protein